MAFCYFGFDILFLFFTICNSRQYDNRRWTSVGQADLVCPFKSDGCQSAAMRFFFLPLSNQRAFLYCQKTASSPSTEAGLITRLVDRVTHRASTTWIKWAKGDKRWQLTIVQWGEKLLQRIPYQEWGLKSIPAPPQLGYDYSKIPRIILSYPGSIISKPSLMKFLQNEAIARQSIHQRRLWLSCVGMPFTIPIALIPVLPNLPFFYLCYRAYSHWRALGGSRHLQKLLDGNLISLQPDPVLDVVYQAGLLNKAKGGFLQPASVTNDQQESLEIMLLENWNAKLIGRAVQCAELDGEMDRALKQITGDIEKQQINVDHDPDVSAK